jgi:hypothetical protein
MMSSSVSVTIVTLKCQSTSYDEDGDAYKVRGIDHAFAQMNHQEQEKAKKAIYSYPDLLGPRFNLNDLWLSTYEFSSCTCQNNSLHPTTSSANLVSCPHLPRLNPAQAAD